MEMRYKCYITGHIKDNSINIDCIRAGYPINTDVKKEVTLVM